MTKFKLSWNSDGYYKLKKIEKYIFKIELKKTLIITKNKLN